MSEESKEGLMLVFIVICCLFVGLIIGDSVGKDAIKSKLCAGEQVEMTCRRVETFGGTSHLDAGVK